MPKEMLTALIAGMASFAAFIVVFGIGLGFIFMFLPTLPIFYVGLGYSLRTARRAIALACLPITLLSGISGLTVYTLFLTLPSYYICRKAMRPRLYAPQSPLVWPALGLIILNLTLMGCTLIALTSAYYWPQEGGLPGVLARMASESFPGLEPDYSGLVERMVTRWAFLIFPITLWLWVLMLYAHAWTAHRMLVQRGRLIRPDFAVHAFELPSWLLSLLVICALAAIIGSDSMRFLGRSCLISLMLPYFFAGMALMRQASKSWPSGGFFMFFIYFLIFTQFWPALILSGIGLWRQIKDLSGHKTSFKE